MIAAFHTNDTGITMAGRIDARLKELKIELPEPTEPSVAKIRNTTMANGFLFVSGQVPRMGGKISFVGKVGREFDLAKGQPYLLGTVWSDAGDRISDPIPIELTPTGIRARV